MPHKQDRQKKPVLLFDVNETLLDLSGVRESVGQLLQGGPETVSLWFTTMLHYSLVSTVAGQYDNFGRIGVAAMLMVARSRNIHMTEKEARRALQPMLSCPPHQEVPSVLEELQDRGYRLAALTNSSREVMQTQLENAGLSGMLEQSFSVEDIRLYKPHSDVYRWAARKMGARPADCTLVAAHGWDVAGAMWAGLQAAFVERSGQQMYPLAAEPEIKASDLRGVADLLLQKA